MTAARMRFASDILRRLGEELNPNLDQGVIELVKNAHDANAHVCTVRLENTESPGGSLVVKDDGDGMTVDEIISNFLVLGRSSKVGVRRTRSGRIPSGSKGLGRLAALRAGERFDLTSVPLEKPSSANLLSIDWKAYEQEELIDEVKLQVESRGRLPDDPDGTRIVVSDLRRAVRREEVRRLARSLVLLSDPFEDAIGAFRPRLIAQEFVDLEQLVAKKYFNDAEYRLEATLETSGRSHARVLDYRGETLFQADHEVLRPSGEIYSSPSARLEFWAFKLDGATFQSRDSTLTEVRAWLREFGGVFLYVNGLRVLPYGDPGNDWLDLNLRRTQSPEERPSTNNSIGRLLVDDQDLALPAKTDRSGLIESDSFSDLRQFALDALEWMARERMRMAETRRQAEREAARSRSTEERERFAEALRDAGPKASQLQARFNEYDKQKEREIEGLRREVQLYRTLSTAGIAAATFAHEAAGGPLKVIGRAVATLKRRLGRPDSDQNEFMEPLNTIGDSASSLAAFTATTLDLIDRDKRRVKRVDLPAAVDKVVTSYSQFFVGRDVSVRVLGDAESLFIFGSVAALESIMLNLINNSLQAFAENGVADREISISVDRVGENAVLVVSDSGPGIRGLQLKDIWLPGITTKPNGTGLGLTIVRDTVADLGGQISVDNNPTGGAVFTVVLPRVGE